MKCPVLLLSAVLLSAGFSAVSCNKYGTAPAVKPVDSVSGTGPAVTDTGTRTYLALGDSYTIGQSVAVGDRYPVQVVNLLNADGYHFQDPEIIARTGWTTGDLTSALKDKSVPVPPYDVVTILIGVNNQYQGRTRDEYREEFTGLLKQAIQLAGNRPSHVIVLSIPDWSVTPFANGRDKAGIAGEIDAFNKINADISATDNTRYLNITEESRKALNDPSLIALDGLHFSGKEYAIWAALLKRLMETAIRI